MMHTKNYIKMDKSSSMEDAIMQFNFKRSASVKRNNPGLEEEPPDVKKRKIKVSPTNQSTVNEKQYFPIASLTLTPKCPEIKGTLTEVSNWITMRSQVQFLTFRVRDESEEIKGLVFAPMDEYFHNNFKPGATVILKNTKVQIAKDGNINDGFKAYQLVVNRLTPLKIEYTSPAPVKLSRKKINDILDNSNARDIVDVMGIIEDVGAIERNSMREIRIIDESKKNIILTLWDDTSKNFDAPLGSVIAGYKLAVRIFDSKKVLRTCHLSKLLIDPPCPKTQRLKKWHAKWTAENRARENQEPTIIENVQQTNDNVMGNSPIAGFSINPLHLKNITSIRMIINTAKAGTKHDIVGLVTECEQPEEKTTKAGNKKWMRSITLKDDEDSKIKMDIWGDPVKNNDIPPHSVIMAKNVTVREYNDEKSLTCLWTYLQIEPNIPQAVSLRKLIANNSNANEIEKSAIAEASSSSSNYSHGQQITPIKEIINMETTESKYHIVALVIKTKPPTEQKTKSGSMMWLRVITLMDDEGNQIELSVWGVSVKNNDIPLYSVIMAKNVLIRKFNKNNTLSCLWADLKIDPNVPEAERFATTSSIFKRDFQVSLENSDNFDSFEKIMAETRPFSKWNLVGLVEETKPSRQLDSRPEKEYWFTKVKLKDADCNRIELVVWSNESLESAIPLDSVLVAKGAETRMINDKVAIGVFWNLIEINPAIPEAMRLNRIRENNSNSQFPSYREICDIEMENYTPIEIIERRNKPHAILDTIGRIVKVEPAKEWNNNRGVTCYTRNCGLQSKSGTEINLIVSTHPAELFEIELNSVIFVREAVVKDTKDEKVTLLCHFMNIEVININ